jgi:hypothetical protein
MKYTPEQLIGRKVRGFKFEDNDEVTFESGMLKYIGQIGEIIDVTTSPTNPIASVRFDNNDEWYYPLDQIEQHLVEETEVLDIPERITAALDSTYPLKPDHPCFERGHAMYSVYSINNYDRGGRSAWGENQCTRCGFKDLWQYDN